MDKSEKSFYVIIENKKRGKFSGAGPIQVAKKVASKKLKAGKEMEFYLDEVAGKKKRYGPYQAWKDKKTDKVVVVKRIKVMKGGLLSENDKSKLRVFFYNFNNHNKGRNMNDVSSKPNEFVISRLPFNEPIIFFDPQFDRGISYLYMFAVFKELNRNIYIMLYNTNDYRNTEIVSMTDFFLNHNKYSRYFNAVGNGRVGLIKKKILESFKSVDIIPSRTICEEARKIYDMLYIPHTNIREQKVLTYVPNYSHPLIRKCVYPDLTFGILDEETRIRTLEFPIPESNQKFLILKQTGLSGMSVNEPVIYVRVPVIGEIQRGGTLTVEQIDNYLKEINELIKKIEIRNTLWSSRNFLGSSMNNIKLKTPSEIKKINDDISLLERNIMGYVLPNPQRIISKQDKELQIIRLNELKIIILEQKLQLQQIQPQQQFRLNEQTQQIKQLERQLKNQEPHFDYCIYTNPTNRKELMIKPHSGTQSFYFYEELNDDNIKNVCYILLSIPVEFVRLERVRRIANAIVSTPPSIIVPEKIKTREFQSNI